MDIHVLLNPASARGRAGARWARLEPGARARFPTLTVHRGRRPGDLEARARELALGSGPALVVAAGGDGTSHEVVNGLVAAGPPPGIVMGWLPLGSGNDLARSAGTPSDPARAIEAWASSGTRRIDVGTLRYRDHAGHETERAFGNSLTVGLSTDVLEWVLRPGRLRGRGGYLIAAVRSILHGRPRRLSIRTPDGQPLFEGPSLLASFTNGPCFGSGMQVAPTARLDDGRLDLVTVPALSRFEALRVFPGIYRGAHLRFPGIEHRTVTGAVIDPAGPTPLEIDGELIAEAVPPIEVGLLGARLTILSPAH